MELSNILSSLDDYFLLSSGNLKTLKALCMGIHDARTVNLQEVCNRFNEGNFSSNTRKVEGFFSKVLLDTQDVTRFVMGRLFSKDASVTLAIDRTQWRFGTCWHNLLCISVLYDSTAIPIAVLPLEHRGNSNTKQRISLLKTVLSVIPAHRINALLGDREFIGDEWFHALKDLNIPFVMRIRDNINVSIDDKCDKITNFMPSNGQKTVNNAHIGTGLFDLSLKKCKKDDLALVSMGIKDPIKFYRKRWGIETGFKCLKTNGFNLEDTHIKHTQRIELLTQICSLAMVLALQAYATCDIKKNKKFNQKNMDINKIQSSHAQNDSL